MKKKVDRSKFYKTGAWVRLRKIQLRKHALCEICLKSGIQTVANTVDHKNCLWEGWKEFLTGPIQSLCSECHRLKTQDDLPKLKKKAMLKMEVWE